VTKKRTRVSEWLAPFQRGRVDPHYAAFFHCFNRGLYFEAHEVLEELWLSCRKGPDDLFYKGLIQLAGAFVHVRKNRLSPARSLFRLADSNLRKCPDCHHHLDVAAVLGLIQEWMRELEAAGRMDNTLKHAHLPPLNIEA
jgi:predicted metal-dependent hydrolase